LAIRASWPAPVIPTNAFTWLSISEKADTLKIDTTYRGQAVVDRGDHERVAHPDDAGREESCHERRHDMHRRGKDRKGCCERREATNNGAHAPRFCDKLSFSAGRRRSFTPAATKHHFIMGAQKNTVFGPMPSYADRNVERRRSCRVNVVTGSAAHDSVSARCPRQASRRAYPRGGSRTTGISSRQLLLLHRTCWVNV
jgi:hypothetical protein